MTWVLNTQLWLTHWDKSWLRTQGTEVEAKPNSRLWEFSNEISMTPKIIRAPNDQHCIRVSAIWNEIYPRYSATAYLYINIRYPPHTCFMWPCSPPTVIFLPHIQWQKKVSIAKVSKTLKNMFFVLNNGIHRRIWTILSYLGSLTSLIYFSTTSLSISCSTTSQKLFAMTSNAGNLSRERTEREI